jgi:5-bromo-4-chloroindolyl phosphate hydrolysis protein
MDADKNEQINQINNKCIKLTQIQFRESENKLLKEIKIRFQKENIRWIEEFNNDVYNIIQNYRCLVLDCETIKQVRHVLEKCIEKLDEIGSKNEELRILMTDVKPYCEKYIHQIILHDLNLIYSPYELDFIKKSLDYLRHKTIEAGVHKILTEL